jgi:hypothetical protein
MNNAHPFWPEAQQQTYTEVALLVCAKGGREILTPREILQGLSPESFEWVSQLPHGHDETFRTTLMHKLLEDEILSHESSFTTRYVLGELGNLLVTNYLEKMLDSSDN